MPPVSHRPTKIRIHVLARLVEPLRLALERLAGSVSSALLELIDKAENPERMLVRMLQEMEQACSSARAELVEAAAQQLRLEQQRRCDPGNAECERQLDEQKRLVERLTQRCLALESRLREARRRAAQLF